MAQNARHAALGLPRTALTAGHRLAGLNTLSTAVHRCRGLSSQHVLRDLVHCRAMQPEWVRRVHEALKMPAKAAQTAPFSLHQQLQVARTGTASERQAAVSSILHWAMACEATAEAAAASAQSQLRARPQPSQQLAQGSMPPGLGTATMAVLPLAISPAEKRKAHASAVAPAAAAVEGSLQEGPTPQQFPAVYPSSPAGGVVGKAWQQPIAGGLPAIGNQTLGLVATAEAADGVVAGVLTWQQRADVAAAVGGGACSQADCDVQAAVWGMLHMLQCGPGSCHPLAAETLCRLAGLPPAAQALSTGPALQRLVALLAATQPDALPAAWYAATALARAAACQPALGQTAAATGALAALVHLLQGPGSLQQAALAAMLQLVMCSKQDAHPDRLLQVVEAGALPQLVTLLNWSGARSSSAQRTAVLACNLLCLAAAEPACKGAFLEGGILQALLAQLHASDASGPAGRAAAVLWRLASQSESCKLDIVREGAASGLRGLLASGHDLLISEGAYLLAVLAENPCTHQCFKAEGCVELLLDLMIHGGPRAARAANAAVVSLATNSDNHFGLVSLGLAPALVATLQAGCPMAQAMACSTMQMLCVVEPRHAAVLLRAGVAPLLVGFVRGSGVNECVRGNAAGVLASLAQLRDCQSEVCSLGAIPALVKLLREGGSRGQTAAAWALQVLAAATETSRKKALSRAAATPVLISRLVAEEPETCWHAVAALRHMSTLPDIRAELIQQRAVCALSKLVQQCCNHVARPEAAHQLHSCVEAVWLLQRLSSDAVARIQLMDQDDLIPALVRLLGLCSRVQDRRVFESAGKPIQHLSAQSRSVLQAAVESLLCSLADDQDQRLLVRRHAILQQWQGSVLDITGVLSD